MVNDERVRAWVRIATDAAVVVGLLLVVVQIRQNTDALTAANSIAVTDQSLAFFQAGLDSQVTAQAIYKMGVGEALSPLERSQYARLQYLNFRIFENAFLQYRRGTYPIEEWRRYQAIITRIVSSDAVVRDEVRERRGWRFTTEFEAELAALMAQAQPTGAK